MPSKTVRIIVTGREPVDISFNGSLVHVIRIGTDERPALPEDINGFGDYLTDAIKDGSPRSVVVTNWPVEIQTLDLRV